MTLGQLDFDGGRPPAAFFRAIAVDVDGTLAEDGRLNLEALGALRGCRDRGVAVVVVTGRTIADLRRYFPQLLEEATAVVAENGAYLMIGEAGRRAASPLDPALGALLRAKGVPWSAGEVLLACSGADEPAVLDAVRQLGYEYELVRNRSALMVLPAGVTKGSGLVAALAELGLSPHSVIGVGDAENDHSLLACCELGVAVANAVDSLKAHADIVLERPDGAGVASLLQGGLLTGEQRLHSRRWRIHLGATSDGTPVTLPASQLNVVIVGDSGDGKSYLAGLIAEQLVSLGYSIVALDPEGDHVGLSRLPGVSVLDAKAVAEAAAVLPLLIGPGASAVVDLSGLDSPAQRRCLEQLCVEVEATRVGSGLPHWVLLDEAHRGLGDGGPTRALLDPAEKGQLLVTWQPEGLPAETVAGADAIIALGGARPSTGLVDLAASAANVAPAAIAQSLANTAGFAVLIEREHPGRVVSFRLGERRTAHLRHEHKYETMGMAGARRFHFRTIPDTSTGRTAGNLVELEGFLAGCDRGVLRHHCPNHDFSRWIAEVLRDRRLATQLARIEELIGRSSADAVVESARIGMIAALHLRSSAARPTRIE